MDAMGRSKRKNNSPLQRDGGKTRRTAEEDGDGIEGDSCSQGGQDDIIADLKDFIRNENARSSQSLAQEIRQCNEERMAAIETSLSFALTTNETLSKRLVEVEQRAQRTEADLLHCAERLRTVEEQLDQVQQRELQDWLIFSGPAISRLSRSGRNEDAPQLLYSMIQQHMGFEMDVTQIREVYRDERQIRVRFTAFGVRSDRFHLVRNKTKLRGSGLYIRERLTPYRQKLFNELMQFKMAQQVSTVFTKDGTVFVIVGWGDRPRPVRGEAAMERLIRNLMETESGSPRQTRAPGSRQTHAGGPAAVVPGVAAGPEGTGAAERHTEPLRQTPGCGRVSAERDQHRQPADDGMTAIRDEQSRPQSAPGTTALPLSAGSGSRPGPGSRPGSGPDFGPGAGSGSRSGSGPGSRSGSGPGSGGAWADLRRAPPGGHDGGGGSRPSADSERTLVVGADERLHAPEASKTRQRFRGDMRQFVTIHSKSD